MTTPTTPEQHGVASDPYREWDAAYLLGSLSPAERREYEEHLASCPECGAAVAEIAAVPGILSRLDAQTALTLDAHPVPDTLLPRLARAVGVERRRRRARTALSAAAASLAAAAAIVAAVVLPAQLGDTGGEGGSTGAAHATLALEQVVPSSLRARVTLSGLAWGTRIDMHCTYGPAATAAPYPSAASPREYSLWVTGKDGSSEEVATWTASPGTSADPTATTRMATGEIASVDVRNADGSVVLLRGVP